MKRTTSILLGAAAFTLLAVLCTAGSLCDDDPYGVYGGTIRLRVIANSDSDADQAVKFAVRDALINDAAGLFDGCESISAAYDTAAASEGRFGDIAERTLEDKGMKYGARVRLVTQYCPVRTYGALTFPAGKYRTLLVELGQAKGKNWFCVMYPPLCLDMARDDVYAERDVFLRCGFTDGQIDALTNGEYAPVKVRFKLIETIKTWFNKRE